MKIVKKVLTVGGLMVLSMSAFALTLQDAVIENPQAKEMIVKDVPPEGKIYAISPDCNLADKELLKN
ncbi:MAG: hypothetical protein N2Z80_01820 [Hydrogenothermaceae bacterium]|nr:hypothetical protein [Hydrogenothermaceae bacterium]